jgi:transcriptional regulator with XRE-family HTH domain/quercetin dioxygenase-like cupin family protein
MAVSIKIPLKIAMPVYTHLDAEYATLGIGARIRAHRRDRGWTLKRLAQRLEVSAGRLSAIENDKLSLGVELFWAMSRLLDVPFAAFLPPHDTRHFYITRRGALEDKPPLPMKLVDRTHDALIPYHNRLWPLALPFIGKRMEPFAMDVAAISDHELQFISHHQEEFLFVLRGSVECQIKTPEGIRKDRLHPGDSIYFWSYLPHCIRSIGPETARGIDVVCAPPDSAESDLAGGYDGTHLILIDTSHRNPIEQIGTKITGLRQANGMSPAEFAERVGISARRLKTIEEGRGSISLQLLLHICGTFRKPYEYFLANAATIERPFASVQRAPQLKRQPPEAPMAHRCFVGATLKPLASGFPSRGMQPHLVTLGRARAARPSRPHRGEEFIYVLHGAVKIETRANGKRFEETLFPGDSCFIDASFPHRFLEVEFHALARTGAQVIAVMWNPGPPGSRAPNGSVTR